MIPFLRVAPIARVGVISYGVYLYHIHALAIAEKVLERLDIHFALAPFLLGTLVCIVVSELSFRLLEAPFLKLKAKFSMIPRGHI